MSEASQESAVGYTIRPYMARLRTLVAAGWVIVTIAGSIAVAPAVAAHGIADVGAVAATGAIDATGTSDVTVDLQALLNRTPDGGVVQLEPDGNYRVEGTLVLEDRHEVVIQGNGARIFASTTGEAHRSQIQILGGSGFDIRNLEIEGANPHAGLDERAYVPELEFQHGISLEGVTDVEIDHVQIHDTYGDLIYISRHEDRRVTEGVWIHDSTFARSGRQGIAVVDGRDVVIERNTFSDMRRATVDLEPVARGWGVENVHIIDNEVGPGRLLFVAAAGAGPVNRVVIARNTLHGRHLTFWVLPPEGERRRHFWVVDNTTDTSAPTRPMWFTRADGVIVHGNRQPMTGDAALVEVADSCDVAITDNNIAPGTVTLQGRSRECNFILPVEPPEPPPVAGRDQPKEPAPPTAAPPPPTTASVPPTTAPATTASPDTSAPGSAGSPSTTQATALGSQLAASDRPGGDGVAGPVVVLAMVLSALVGAGGAWAVSARRGRH